MNRDNLLKAIFSDKARELPSPYDDVSVTLWGNADAEDEDADDFDDEEDRGDCDEGSFPMAPEFPTLVMCFEDATVTALVEQLGDVFLDTPQISGPYWDGRANYSVAEMGSRAWIHVEECYTTDEDEHPASAVGALLTLDDESVALVLLGAPQTFEEITREGPLPHSDQIRALLGVDTLPETTIERGVWFM